MSLSAANIMEEVQYLMAEPPDNGFSWTSGFWTADEVLGDLREAQERLFTTTGLVLKHTANLPCTPGNLRQDLPSDWIATWSVAWHPALGGSYPLERADPWQLDQLLPNWRLTPDRPRFWTDADTQTLALQLAPAPSVPGTLDLLYLALPDPNLTSRVSEIACPDELEPHLLWDLIACMLSKTGRAHDPARAAAAEQLSGLFLDAAKLLLQGGA